LVCEIESIEKLSESSSGVTPEDGSARLASSLAAVDEENFCVGKSWAAAKVVGDTYDIPETSAPFSGRVIRTKSAPNRGGSQQKYKKPRSGIGAFDLSGSLHWRLASTETVLRSPP